MQATAETLELMGGKKVLGLTSASGLDLVRLVRRGIPVHAVDHVVNSGLLSLSEMDRVVMPRKTLYNRRKQGALTPEQSDRLVRVARILAEAINTFANSEKANIWLRRSTSLLGGEKPLDLLDTDEGARAVEAALGRIAHGIFA